MLADGKVVVAGTRMLASVLSSVGFFSRIAADGSTVETTVAFNLPSTPLSLPPRVRGFAPDPRGGLVVTGAAWSPPSVDGGMFAARYDAATLTIDPNFGLGGKQEFDFTGLPGYTLPQAGAFAIAFDGGRPLLAGDALFDTGGSNFDFAVARRWSGWIFLDGFESADIARWRAASGAP